MAETCFLADELASELDGVRVIGSGLLAPEADGRLRDAVASLKRFASKQQSGKWEVPQLRPISTRVSEGSHQRDDRGAHHLSAHVSWQWNLHFRKGRTIEIAGLASMDVIVKKHNAAGESEALRLNFDIGVEGGPGPAYHAQVKAVGGTSMKFDGSDLDVPRIASIVLTPGECIELVLSELFQDAWPRAVSAQSAYTSVWQKQRARMSTMLQSAATRIQGASGMTAWTAYKSWCPAGVRFQHEDRAQQKGPPTGTRK